MKIVVITDLHYSLNKTSDSRRGDLALILLQQTVDRLNSKINPDVTLILGDLLDNGVSPVAEDSLQNIRDILDKLSCPYIAIPGNHDPEPTIFYSVIPRPEEIVQIGGTRFIPFLDKEEPGWNASRSKEDLKKFHRARHDFEGSVIALQHVCLSPPENSVVPFNYTNAAEIIETMKKTGVTLSVSGHHHGGVDTLWDEDVSFINAPGLCKPPFAYTVITLEEGEVNRETQYLDIENKQFKEINHRRFS